MTNWVDNSDPSMHRKSSYILVILSFFLVFVLNMIIHSLYHLYLTVYGNWKIIGFLSLLMEEYSFMSLFFNYKDERPVVYAKGKMFVSYLRFMKMGNYH